MVKLGSYDIKDNGDVLIYTYDGEKDNEIILTKEELECMMLGINTNKNLVYVDVGYTGCGWFVAWQKGSVKKCNSSTSRNACEKCPLKI